MPFPSGRPPTSHLARGVDFYAFEQFCFLVLPFMLRALILVAERGVAD
jgi:hypothetical protein